MEKQLDQLLDTVISHDTFSDDVKSQTEWVISDTVVATLFGIASEKEVREYLKDKASTEQTSERSFPILGTDVFTNRKDNLMLHGTATVANELDEGNTSAKGHPSAHILPTMFVSAYENDATIEQVIDAYIKAYEISSRLSYACSMRDDMHPHGTWGNVGGAVARALIEGKGKEAIKEIILLSLSLPLATAWQAAEKGQSVRNLYTGLGSFLAYESVDFQAYGFASNMEVTENIWGTIMGNGINSERLTEDLMDPPLITKNYFKVHPACRFTHAAIDATIAIKDENGIAYTDIDTVQVETYSLAARCHTNEPTTKLQSKFSIPYAVACTLMDVDMFEDYASNLQQVDALVQKTTVHESEDITKLLPSKRAARVTITLKDGTTHEHMIDNAQGEYSFRFSKEQMWNKYENMLKGHYSNAFFKGLQDNLLDMRNCSTFKEWLEVNQL